MPALYIGFESVSRMEVALKILEVTLYSINVLTTPMSPPLALGWKSTGDNTDEPMPIGTSSLMYTVVRRIFSCGASWFRSSIPALASDVLFAILIIYIYSPFTTMKAQRLSSHSHLS